MGGDKASQEASDLLSAAESSSYLADTELLRVTVVQPEHAVVVAHLAGEADMLTGPSLQRHLFAALATQPKRLIVDLSQVSFMGATGLAVLIITKQAATQQGTTLQLRGVSRAAALPLQATELSYLFEMLPPV